MGPLGPWQPSAFSCNSHGCLPTSAPLQLNAADMISHNISEESKQRRETTIEYSTFSSVTDYSVTVTVDLRPLQFIYQHDWSNAPFNNLGGVRERSLCCLTQTVTVTHPPCDSKNTPLLVRVLHSCCIWVVQKYRIKRSITNKIKMKYSAEKGIIFYSISCDIASLLLLQYIVV